MQALSSRYVQYFNRAEKGMVLESERFKDDLEAL